MNVNKEMMKKEADKYGIPFEKNGRILVWHDEFDGDKIDGNKWNFRRTMSGTDRVYDNSEKHARVENGNMHMQLHKCDEEGKPYSLSEGFTTSDTMNFRYGRIEMCAKLPFRHGAWPSFWMQSVTPFAKATYLAEIDILEVFSSENSLASALHKWSDGMHSANAVSLDGGTTYTFENYENLNNEYHVYALEWNEDTVSFFVDDIRFASYYIDMKDPAHDFDPVAMPGMQGFHDPAFIIMNNEFFSMGGSWCPGEEIALNDNDEMPVDYFIDWVRLYQNPDTDVIYLKDEIAAAKAAKEAK